MNADKANDTIDAARRLQRALYRAAKASPERRFHALFDKVSRADIMARAWQEVQANAGAAGVDGQSIAEFAELNRADYERYGKLIRETGIKLE